MRVTTPRLIVAGTSGDSGKTLVSLGLARACADRGLGVAPFKKGPDYIDSAWLGAAARRSGRNLDTFLMDEVALGDVLRRGGDAGLMLVEGNRGLHDGFDAAGSHSTGTLAKRLAAPVLLVLDVTKTTRTAAAIALGCKMLDPEVPFAGVVLNQVGTKRQEGVIRAAIEAETGLPVLGAIPRLRGDDPLPGRHLGLVTAVEHPDADAAIERAAAAVREFVDVDAVLDAARAAAPVEFPDAAPVVPGETVRVAVLRDEALSFYYPENLEALVERGAELRFVSPLRDKRLPEVDALYLGGGFPEVHAAELAANAPLRAAVKRAAEAGVPIYAECGGLMLLARTLRVDGTEHPMCDVLDLDIEHTPKPQGHGYAAGTLEGETPFFPKGSALRGHEFHYSRVTRRGEGLELALSLTRGHGVEAKRDGAAAGRVWASYTHVHAAGCPAWADGLLAVAREYRAETGRGDDTNARRASA